MSEGRDRPVEMGRRLGQVPGAAGRAAAAGTAGRGAQMSGVRVLVGTRKGAFVLSSDGKRERWDVSGPHFAGREVYHVKGSPVDPDRLYASQCSGWAGQVIQRSDDRRVTREAVGDQFAYGGVPAAHPRADGTPHPWAV